MVHKSGAGLSGLCYVSGMQIGYARVSTQAQTLDRQIGALNSAGVDRIFREKASARTVRNRPQLERAIDALGAGDVLVIAEWDRATRSMMDGITAMSFARVWRYRAMGRRNAAHLFGEPLICWATLRRDW